MDHALARAVLPAAARRLSKVGAAVHRVPELVD